VKTTSDPISLIPDTLRGEGRVNLSRQGVVSAKFSPEAKPVPGTDPAGDRPTRERVARSVLAHGPSTVAALAARLALTPAAIRRHLDALLGDGVIEARDQHVYGRRRRGRPAKVFALTDAGRDAFFQEYDDLAASALRFIRETGGDELVAQFARTRVGELEDRYRPVVDAAPAERKAVVLAERLTADGYAATADPAPGRGGEQLCQHHCPVSHVAEQFPVLCEAETEVFARLLGTHVQRLATIAHGDGVCTTYVPDPALRAGPRTTGTATTATATRTQAATTTTPRSVGRGPREVPRRARTPRGVTGRTS
jgi:predicted ArsR family transcriptional regulator